jgi:hypothetical protein
MKTLVLIVLTAALAGCAKPALYQPLHDDVGYGEQQLESNRYRVWFAGNSATPREVVEDYVLYRCAELTLEKGYDYFVLADRSTQGEHHDRGGVSFGIGGFRFGGGGGISLGVGTGVPVGDPKYYGQADAVLMKGKKPANDASAFDAREIQKNLEPGIIRKAPEGS